MEPFDQYPGGGRTLFGPVRGAICRRGYGLDFMRRTGQTACAYCGLDFSSSYEAWLTMALDHVVPASVCNNNGFPSGWSEDGSNRVLACAACNGFRNRYRPLEASCPTSLERFFDLRDQIFEERLRLIAESHALDRAFFESRPWETRLS